MKAPPLNFLPPLDPWVAWAFKELANGVKEIPGGEHNERILDYHSHVTSKATSDEVAWCSSALCCGMHECGLPSPISAAARDWLGWGRHLQSFRFGAVAVFWRESVKSWKGHVGLAMRETDKDIWVLGGNQGNEWSILPYPKKQLLSYQWPEDYDSRTYYPLRSH